jgi:hypothetical protein
VPGGKRNGGGPAGVARCALTQGARGAHGVRGGAGLRVAEEACAEEAVDYELYG